MWDDKLCIAAIKHRPDAEEGLTMEQHLGLLNNAASWWSIWKTVSIRILFLADLEADTGFLAHWDNTMKTDMEKKNYKVDDAKISCEILGTSPDIYTPSSSKWTDVTTMASNTFAEWTAREKPNDIIGIITFNIGIQDNAKINTQFALPFLAFVNNKLKQIILVESYKPSATDSNLGHVNNKLKSSQVTATLQSSGEKLYKIHIRLQMSSPIQTSKKIQPNSVETSENVICNRFISAIIDV